MITKWVDLIKIPLNNGKERFLWSLYPTYIYMYIHTNISHIYPIKYIHSISQIISTYCSQAQDWFYHHYIPISHETKYDSQPLRLLRTTSEVRRNYLMLCQDEGNQLDFDQENRWFFKQLLTMENEGWPVNQVVFRKVHRLFGDLHQHGDFNQKSCLSAKMVVWTTNNQHGHSQKKADMWVRQLMKGC